MDYAALTLLLLWWMVIMMMLRFLDFSINISQGVQRPLLADTIMVRARVPNPTASRRKPGGVLKVGLWRCGGGWGAGA